MATLFFRTLIIYVVLIAALRLMGKRQVGELEVSELVITFLLSELAVLPISNRNAPLSHGLIPVLLLLAFEVILSYVSSKSPLFRKVMLGKPSVIINKGALDRDELSKLRISVTELMSELRQKGVSSISEVEYAIIEDNGKLSVFKRSDLSPVSRKDAGIETEECGIAHCVIAEGEISDDELRSAKRDRAWLGSVLKAKGAAACDVYLMTVDDGGRINIIMKGNEK